MVGRPVRPCGAPVGSPDLPACRCTSRRGADPHLAQVATGLIVSAALLLSLPVYCQKIARWQAYEDQVYTKVGMWLAHAHHTGVAGLHRVSRVRWLPYHRPFRGLAGAHDARRTSPTED